MWDDPMVATMDYVPRKAIISVLDAVTVGAVILVFWYVCYLQIWQRQC